MQPICENYPTLDQLSQMEPFYPLHLYFCETCHLVQLADSISPKELYSNYAYFSSHSKGWMNHVENYVNIITKRFNLNARSQVIEIASNDGYLLQYFAQKNIPVLGIEPAANVAKDAIKKGIPTVIKFFGLELSKELKNENKQADLLIGNNIIAQVPDLNGFVAGFKNLLKPSGVITIEFHHLMKMIDNGQFDTISHERFSYLSFIVVEKIFEFHGLTIFDVEEIPTHSGSLRIYACHAENKSHPITSHVAEIREKEKAAGLTTNERYLSFSKRIKTVKREVLSLILDLKSKNKLVVGYGAHAEAHTFLNYCGLNADFLDYTVDRNPVKQGKFVAGVHIPIFPPDKIIETKPDYVFILPWTIKDEIMKQMSHIGEWGGKFIVAIPKLQIYDSHGLQICNEV